jgi:hypothetical protein
MTELIQKRTAESQPLGLADRARPSPLASPVVTFGAKKPEPESKTLSARTDSDSRSASNLTITTETDLPALLVKRLPFPQGKKRTRYVLVGLTIVFCVLLLLCPILAYLLMERR